METAVADEPKPSKCVCQATPPAIATTPIPTTPAKTVRRETTRLLSVTGSGTSEASSVTGVPLEDPVTGVKGAKTAEADCPLVGVMRAVDAVGTEVLLDDDVMASTGVLEPGRGFVV